MILMLNTTKLKRWEWQPVSDYEDYEENAAVTESVAVQTATDTGSLVAETAA